MRKKFLKGITWNHSRGYTPLVATSQRFNELNPEVEIDWEKRTLYYLAYESLLDLSQEYDLLVIDHPWVGYAAAHENLLPLDKYLDKKVITGQSENSVGRSFESYSYEGHEWALPIDAATPVAAYREDLFKEKGGHLPETYKEVLDLASEGKVAVPGIPIDSLMNFYMFCATLAEEPFLSKETVVSFEIGTEALQLQRELLVKVDKRCFDWNPIRVYEMLSKTDEFMYCPFAYGYTNFAREGYANHRLRFHDLVSLRGNKKLRSTLGGTGIAVSAQTKEVEAALSYVEYITSEHCQKTLFFDAGGQPAHGRAWDNKNANFQCDGFFKDTLPAYGRAYLRPRYNGYLEFQDHAGDVVRDYLMHGGGAKQIDRKS